MANINDAYGVIEQVNTAGNKYNVASTSCAYCETPAGTADKVAALAGFKYIPGVTVHVYFKYANTASNPTLNVNNEQAYPIMLYGTQNAGADSETTGWQAGSVVSFTYVEVDSTHKYWYRDQGYNTKNAGTVTSVQVQASSPLQSSVSAAQNSSLNTTISFTNQDAHTILAGPTSGSAAAPTFRSLESGDIPGLPASKITSGTLSVARGGTGADSFASGSVLIGNGTGAIQTKSIDTTVTANSDNLITSGAVATAISSLTGAMHLLGITTTNISTGTANTNATVSIGGSNKTATDGDVVLYGNQEYVWANGKWNLLGDEGSYALDDNVIHKNDFNNKGEIIYASGDNAYSILGANSTTTNKVLYMASSTPAWKELGINPSTTKAVTAVAYSSGTTSSGTGTWPTISKGSGTSISGIDSVGTPATAVVTNAILTITDGTAPTKATAVTVPNLADIAIDTTNAKWPELSVTKTTDFLTGASITYT